MDIEYDSKKNARNISKRGINFDRVDELDWDNAQIKLDDRKDYGEDRYHGVAVLDGWLHFICFTPTDTGIRVISLRKASKKEEKIYYEQT